MMNNYRLNTNILRGLIYIVLFVLLIVTILPIWLLLVNASRSTVQNQLATGPLSLRENAGL